ncbi:hypothetical protein YH65_05125 [Sulfurovum lithotrophicum]|uniref:Uncharacterized protein n=1 Tax=Sulfurovum lithotrophicum TaxID=206403 RepID=A0A7U4RQK5_9BACT|nr:hypothetical protein [Sulfurovum lithotrophicum]AKF24836.1 hypothetical protein YH65_05125 [Sulfurovum lithotrophicum]
MLNFLKKIFSRKEETVEPEYPGRTFNRIITSKYFGYNEENSSTDTDQIAKIKQSKIDQINEFELLPKFLYYAYSPNGTEIESAYVIFQKEAISQRGSMIHVTELAFTVRQQDFNEFEKMANVSLKNDFRDLTDHKYNGEERRKGKRGL